MQDKFAKVEAAALRLGDEQRLDTIRFFRNVNLIYDRYNDWKDIDRFYFITLKQNLTYRLAGQVISMADSPLFLGSFVRTSLEYPELFDVVCPECGKVLHPYGYNGSPLSGRVDLEATCPCGWDSYVSVSGWRIRSEALKATQKADRLRYLKSKFTHIGDRASSVAELLDYLNG